MRFILTGIGVGIAGVAVLAPHLRVLHAQSDPSWPMYGQNLSNTRFASAEATITPANVGQLINKWTFTAQGDISATPSVDATNNVLYFPDWAGYIYKVNASTGQLIWRRSMADYGLPAGTLCRNTPTIAGSLIIIGASSVLGKTVRVGGYLLALDAGTGNVVWQQQVDPSPYALVTGSPAVYQGVVYVGVASGEEFLATPSFRGSVVAYQAATGAFLWQTYMVPVGYTGAPIWSGTPAIDPKRNSLYVTTGNNYTVPASVESCEEAVKTQPAKELACQDPQSYFDSIVSLDLTTGAIKWGRRVSTSDAWTFACLYNGPTCPAPEGSDFDFGAGANFFTTTVKGKTADVIGAGQKSGLYWALNPDTGTVIWERFIGPGGMYGGIQWGTATDGQNVYIPISNSSHKSYKLQPQNTSWTGGSWAAVLAGSGTPLWQTPDPGKDPTKTTKPAMDMGPLTVANGVVYAPSMSGNVYALSAANGSILWSFNTGASVNAGAAVVNGTVYWGSGYAHGPSPLGTGNNKLFAFSLPAP